MIHHLKHFTLQVVACFVLKMLTLKVCEKVAEVQLLTVGLYGKKALLGTQKLNGLTNCSITYNDLYMLSDLLFANMQYIYRVTYWCDFKRQNLN